MLDGSFFLVEDIQPDSLNTTRMVENMVDEIDFVLHIGDISYARGFSSVVSWPNIASYNLKFDKLSFLRCTTFCSLINCYLNWCSGTCSSIRLSPLPVEYHTWCAQETMKGTHQTHSKIVASYTSVIMRLMYLLSFLMCWTVLACTTTQGPEESVEYLTIIVLICQDPTLMNPGDLACSVCTLLLVPIIILYMLW